MSNTFIDLEKIGQRMLPRFLENLLMPQLVYKDYSNEFVNGLGSTIQIRKPFEFTASEFNGTVSPQDINEQSITVTLDKISDVTVSVSALSMAMQMGDVKLNEIIDGMAVALAQKVNNDGLGMVCSAGKVLKKPAEAYDLDDIADFRLILNDEKAPMQERRIVWNTNADADFTRIGNLIKVNESGTSTALREGEIGRIFGCDNYMAQTLPKSNTAHGITATVASKSATDAHVLQTTASACTLVAGDTIKLSNGADAPKHLIKDVKATASGYDITLIDEIGASETITAGQIAVVASETSFGFHKNAVAFVTRPLSAPAGDTSKVAVVNYNGIALRLVRDYDITHKTDIISVDILYNYQMITPEHAVAIVK